MTYTDTLDGLKIEASFSVTNEADVKVENCQAVFTLDGVKVSDLLNVARKSLVIDLQRNLRKLSKAEIEAVCVDKVHRIHASEAGLKIESPETKKAKLKAALMALSAEERAELLRG